MFGGVELGGTKILVGVADQEGQFADQLRIPTTHEPGADLYAVAQFLSAYPLTAVGVGSFGPCDANPTSPTYGLIGNTPKPGWAGINVRHALQDMLRMQGAGKALPIAFTSDVSAAALAEYRAHASAGVTSLLYVTVGTGIGGGHVVDGRITAGAYALEMGHQRIPRDSAEQPGFAGVCPYHRDCWEGLASGPAMAHRWGQPAELLPGSHAAWDLEATYIAVGLHNLTCSLAPEVIVLGGGVGSADQLLPLVRGKLVESLAGYLDNAVNITTIEDYLRPPALNGLSGLYGCIALAQSQT